MVEPNPTKHKLFNINRFALLCGISVSLIFLIKCTNEPRGKYPKIQHPNNNKPSKAKIELGKKLFFDPILSQNGTVSCGTCHLPALAFTDGKKVSPTNALDLEDRNTPTLLYVGFKPELFMEGGVRTLEQQASAPFLTQHEFNLDLHDAADKLKKDTEYIKAFQKAFKNEPNALDITKALATYQRSLNPFNSKFDEFYKGNLTLLTPQEKAGYNLFVSDKINCASCHIPPLFTNHTYHLTLVATTDEGRARQTFNPEDKEKFMVPTLKNIALTSPYMHNGSVENLREAILLYNNHERINFHRFTEPEIESLVAFLKTLTDKNLEKL
ncbi:MAG: cytochrome-c peroxidase [Luteibaculaceae bacterium]